MDKLKRFILQLFTSSLAFIFLLVAIVYVTYSHPEWFAKVTQHQGTKESDSALPQRSTAQPRSEAVAKLTESLPKDTDILFDYAGNCQEISASRGLTFDECMILTGSIMANIQSKKTKVVSTSIGGYRSPREKVIYQIFNDIPSTGGSNFDVGRYCLRAEKTGVITFDECLNVAAAKISRQLQ
ncbi:conserved hypothetical protein [Marinobacter salarius]|uniref:hypothetical protein n=1 Tax=Marinobacter salarius TaxID=1420917 RepID=UPI0012523CA4|nr:hypothetical protein [Marinobacter salarius]VVT09161.1 conserved hypothetical protein [Marinobacter salarius]VXB93204.1 conserved hypothetical protein [Marinobacter salarius]